MPQVEDVGPCAPLIEHVIEQGSDRDLNRINALAFAAAHKLDEERTIAAFLHGEQLRRLEDAARRVQQRLPPDAPVVAVGSGAFLGPEVAARLGRAVADAPASWGAAGTEVAPAAALAALLAARLC